MVRTRSSQLNPESGDGSDATAPIAVTAPTAVTAPPTEEAAAPKQRVKKHVGSLEKKRARDRRAQQAMRAKRQSHVESLEDRIATLEAELQRSRTSCEALRQQNRILHSRQDAVGRLVTSWGGHSPKPPTPSSTDTGEGEGDDCATTPSRVLENASSSDTSTVAVALAAADTVRDELMAATMALFPKSPLSQSYAAMLPHPSADDAALLGSDTSLWSMVPSHSGLDVIVTDQFCRWLRRPDLVRQSPDQPSPLDIIHGSDRNFLANVIAEATQQWPCRDPERLAGGWLCYHFIKWMLCPDRQAYFRLQPFQKPVEEQLERPHPYFVDFLFWPGMRANMVKYQHLYDPVEVMSLLTCCIKVRWPWRKPFLQSDEKGVAQFHPDFYDTFTKLDGWGVTDEFAFRYPKLVEGLDMNTVRYSFDT